MNRAKDLCKKYNGKMVGKWCVVENLFPEGYARIFIMPKKEDDFVVVKFENHKVFVGFPDKSDPKEADADITISVSDVKGKHIKVKNGNMEIVEE